MPTDMTGKGRDSLSSDDILASQNESLLSEHSRASHYERRKAGFRGLRLWLSIAVALVASNLLTVALCFTYFKHGNNLLRWTSSYSPVLEKLNIPTTSRELHIPLLPNATDPRDIYRLPPSPSVDEAWDRITRVNLISLTDAEVRALGKDPALTVRAPESWWSEAWGSGGSLGQLDAFHQIHCLNMLRQGLVTNYNYYWGRKYGLSPPVAFGMHLNHCLGSLLENLMCRADADVVTFNWRQGQPDPFPDFAVRKQCRDFGALARWQRDHQIDDTINRWKALEKPAGAQQRESPPGLDNVDADGDGEIDGVRVLRLHDVPEGCRPETARGE